MRTLIMPPPLPTRLPRSPEARFAKTKSDPGIVLPAPLVPVDLTADTTYGPQPRFFHPTVDPQTNGSTLAAVPKQRPVSRNLSLIDFSNNNESDYTFGPQPKFFTPASPAPITENSPKVHEEALTLHRIQRDLQPSKETESNNQPLISAVVDKNSASLQPLVPLIDFRNSLRSKGFSREPSVQNCRPQYSPKGSTGISLFTENSLSPVSNDDGGVAQIGRESSQVAVQEDMFDIELLELSSREDAKMGLPSSNLEAREASNISLDSVIEKKPNPFNGWLNDVAENIIAEHSRKNLGKARVSSKNKEDTSSSSQIGQESLLLGPRFLDENSDNRLIPLDTGDIQNKPDKEEKGTAKVRRNSSRFFDVPIHEHPLVQETPPRILACASVSYADPKPLVQPPTPKKYTVKCVQPIRRTRTLFGSTRTINEDFVGAERQERHPVMSTIFSWLKPSWTIGSTMKCSCMSSAGSYERLPHVSTFLDLSSIYNRDSEDKDSSTEKQEELVFYNDDNSSQTVVVEKDLCVSDLCQLLALKNRVSKDVNWTIVEHWVDLGLERSLEDHEDVLEAYQSMESFSKKSAKKFVFRKDFIKYEFFHNPQEFFPVNMIDWGEPEEVAVSINKSSSLQAILASGEECPAVFSDIWVQDTNKQSWSKAFLVLKDRKLYLSSKIQVIKNLLRRRRFSSCSSAESSPTVSLSSSPNNRTCEEGEAEVFADVSNYHIYTSLNAKNHLRAPTEFGICLRPVAPYGDSNEGPLTSLKCLACESDRVRLCWITAMRLAKYGKQLRENYRSFRNKHLEAMSPKQYNSFILPNESVRSRVPMDFTGNVGRIVDDPKEAKAIALAEGYTWKRRWRPVTRHSSGKLVNAQIVQNGVHMTQPWFHSGMTRDMAAALIAKHGTVDGVFLVRDCQSSPGAFVLTLKSGAKVVHKEIHPLAEAGQDTVCYSLDAGQTKFYDLLQLVEFYQLNTGSLPSRLTHYLVQSASGTLYREKTIRNVSAC